MILKLLKKNVNEHLHIQITVNSQSEKKLIFHTVTC